MRLVPVPVAAVALNVKPDTVRQMFKRGRLTRYGGPRCAMVDLGECEILRLGHERAA